MSVRGLIEAVSDGNFEEVVRYVDEEHVEVNSEDQVSFPFFLKKSQSSFVCFVFE